MAGAQTILEQPVEEIEAGEAFESCTALAQQSLQSLDLA